MALNHVSLDRTRQLKLLSSCASVVKVVASAVSWGQDYPTCVCHSVATVREYCVELLAPLGHIMQIQKLAQSFGTLYRVL